MNKNVRKLLQDFKVERELEEEQKNKKREKIIKGIDKSTNKAYLLVWKTILEKYKTDIQSKNHKDNYFVAINIISLDEMIYLTKTKLIRANVKYLEELRECNELNSKNIVGAEIDYESINMVFPEKLLENLEKDNFQIAGANTYGISTDELKRYIENSDKKNTKTKQRKK